MIIFFVFATNLFQSLSLKISKLNETLWLDDKYAIFAGTFLTWVWKYENKENLSFVKETGNKIKALLRTIILKSTEIWNAADVLKLNYSKLFKIKANSRYDYRIITTTYTFFQIFTIINAIKNIHSYKFNEIAFNIYECKFVEKNKP